LEKENGMGQVNFIIESFETSLFGGNSGTLVGNIICNSSPSEKKMLRFELTAGLNAPADGLIETHSGITWFRRQIPADYYAWIVETLRNSSRVEATCFNTAPFQHGIRGYK